MLELANAFSERGLDVDLVLTRAEGEYLDMVHDGVRVIDLAASRLTVYIWFLRYAWTERPNVVLATVLFQNLAALLAKVVMGRRLRVIVRQAGVLTPSFNGVRFRRRQVNRLLRTLFPFADHVVAVSEGVAQDVREQFPRVAHKITTIYNPVDLPRGHPSEGTCEGGARMVRWTAARR